MQLEINTELQVLIPPLSADEYSRLEKSIVAEGCRDAIVVWNGIIVDGHNRYAICNRHGVYFRTVDAEFATIQDAMVWMIDNQLSRRNLPDFCKCELVAKKKELLLAAGIDEMKEGGKEGRYIQLTGGLSIIDKPPKEAHNTQKAIAKDLDWSTGKVAMAEVVMKKADEATKEKLRKAEISINQAYVEIKKTEKVQRRAERDNGLREVEKFPDGLYTVIYADPPWRYDFSETTSREIENQYPTMDIEEIKAMQIPSAKDAVLFLWGTAPKLREALAVMEAWGFEYKTHAIWDKGKIGMGYWFRGQHELLLIGTKGNYPPPAPCDRVSSVISIARGKHSAKPDLYGLIEKMCPGGKYLELFARGEVGGKWTIWGNQAK